MRQQAGDKVNSAEAVAYFGRIDAEVSKVLRLRHNLLGSYLRTAHSIYKIITCSLIIFPLKSTVLCEFKLDRLSKEQIYNKHGTVY